ncbi:hypothetical protein BUE80_DR013692 [Diplocarpon rosae]|nr:hypothetical protein BUE80_DR013692 [Diplocarpon rosae]
MSRPIKTASIVSGLLHQLAEHDNQGHTKQGSTRAVAEQVAGTKRSSHRQDVHEASSLIAISTIPEVVFGLGCSPVSMERSSAALFQEAEAVLEKWKHPDPYHPPTAPGAPMEITK